MQRLDGEFNLRLGCLVEQGGEALGDLPASLVQGNVRIATDMTAGVKEKYDAMLAEGLTLDPRWGQPEDIGRAVAVLARGELTYATGQVLVIDGGLTRPRL